MCCVGLLVPFKAEYTTIEQLQKSMSGSEEEEFLPDDVADNDDVVIAQEEISQSLKKMNKIVNNLMARADCVPFREPVDWKGLEVSMNVYFIYLWCYVFI